MQTIKLLTGRCPIKTSSFSPQYFLVVNKQRELVIVQFLDRDFNFFFIDIEIIRYSNKQDKVLLQYLMLNFSRFINNFLKSYKAESN